ncbi:MAG: addiction module protein [Pirellulaceae bacterium]
MTDFDEILNAAQSLPGSERAQLIAALWGNLSPEEWLSPSPEWVKEAERRSAQYDANQIAASPWSEVRERARRKAGLAGQ